MRVFFDSSVLVPCLSASHRDHGAASRAVDRVHAGEVAGVVSTHCLAETWAVLTVLPFQPPLAEADALSLVNDAIISRFEIAVLDAEDYRVVLKDAVRNRLRGGSIHDALHVHAARKARADLILTYDVRDFRRAAPDLADRIRTP